MEIKTTYISDDGTEFDTEEECLQYEAVYKDTSSVMLFDGGLNEMDSSDLKESYETASYIYIVNAQSARLLFDYIYASYGYPLPYQIEEGHMYRYDERIEKWEDVNEVYRRSRDALAAVKTALGERV